jgi:hypothetical protein
MIIGGFVLIIVLAFVGFQLIKPEHLKLKINWHSLELEMKRASSERKTVPSKRPTKKLPQQLVLEGLHTPVDEVFLGREVVEDGRLRDVGNRLAPLFRPSLVSKLSVPGRRSGRWHTLPIVVLDHDGERYLVSYRGESDWVLDLRASNSGRLARRGHVEEITVVEVPVPDRPPLIEAYRARYGKVPTVAATLRALPDPADHPTFRIIASAEGPPSAN